MIYKIEWIEEKASAKGTRYWKASLKGEDGKITDDVAIFSSFKGGEIKLGESVEGELKSSLYNGKTSYTLENLQTSSTGANRGQSGAFKAKVIEEAQVRKEGSINRTLDRKEESIKLSSAQRDAVLIVTTFYKDSGYDDRELKELIIKWRDWFLGEEFNSVVPF